MEGSTEQAEAGAEAEAEKTHTTEEAGKVVGEDEQGGDVVLGTSGADLAARNAANQEPHQPLGSEGAVRQSAAPVETEAVAQGGESKTVADENEAPLQ